MPASFGKTLKMFNHAFQSGFFLAAYIALVLILNTVFKQYYTRPTFSFFFFVNLYEPMFL